MNIKVYIRSEAEKLKQMSSRDRRWYIWEYYKFHILVLLLAAGLLAAFCNVLYRQTFTTRLSFVVVNDQSGAVSSMEPLEDVLRQELGYGKKDIIEINEGLYVSFDDQSMSQYAYASLTKISALAASHALDFMIADQSAVEHYGKNSALWDLREFLPEDLYKRMETEIFYAEDESGTLVPVAISLEHTRFSEITGVVMSPPYLAVVKGAPHTEDTLRVIQYLFP